MERGLVPPAGVDDTADVSPPGYDPSAQFRYATVMKWIVNPITMLVIAVATVVAAVAFFLEYRLGSSAHGVGGIAGGFLVMGGAALLAAAHLHKRP